MKMLQPGTAFAFPVTGSTRRAGAPMRPTSASWTWPQLLGQPVTWRRRGRPIRSSSISEISFAKPLVSMMATGQNWAPVQETVLPLTAPGFKEKFGSVFSASARRATGSATDGNMTFCSTVSRISPSPYFSARSARAPISFAKTRPTGTCSPTRQRPSSVVGNTPTVSRRASPPGGGRDCFRAAPGMATSLRIRSRNFSTPP
mmetsp:Transcript_2987/g.9959  ORF Transcript_2987/g.9959 Transcript_2987/m.9959 type:complete len:202 (-) Transcript_2987:1865-2470(-)